MNKKYIISGLLIIITLFYLFYIIGTTKITIHFKDLEPLKHHLPVYYNGFKLGHTTKVYPSKDYKSTMVDIRIVTKNLKLPANTTATLRRKDKKDYIELEYPNAPYIAHLHHKDIIEGYLGINFEHYLQDQAENGGLDEIKANVNQTIKSAGQTFDALTQMINKIDKVQQIKDIEIEGILMTKLDNKNTLGYEIVDKVKFLFPSKIFKTIITRSSHIQEAPMHGMTVLSFSFNSRGSKEYRMLAEEILDNNHIKYNKK